MWLWFRPSSKRDRTQPPVLRLSRIRHIRNGSALSTAGNCAEFTFFPHDHDDCRRPISLSHQTVLRSESHHLAVCVQVHSGHSHGHYSTIDVMGYRRNGDVYPRPIRIHSGSCLQPLRELLKAARFARGFLLHRNICIIPYLKNNSNLRR